MTTADIVTLKPKVIFCEELSGKKPTFRGEVKTADSQRSLLKLRRKPEVALSLMGKFILKFTVISSPGCTKSRSSNDPARTINRELYYKNTKSAYQRSVAAEYC